MAWKSTLELGELIVSTPELLTEVERLVDVLLMPRGARVKLRKALAKVREDQTPFKAFLRSGKRASKSAAAPTAPATEATVAAVAPSNDTTEPR